MFYHIIEYLSLPNIPGMDSVHMKHVNTLVHQVRCLMLEDLVLVRCLGDCKKEEKCPLSRSARAPFWSSLLDLS